MRCRFWLVVGLVGFLIGATAGVAHAYIWGDLNHSCFEENATYKFLDSQPPDFGDWQLWPQDTWTTATKNHVSQGADQWDLVTNASGAGLVTTTNSQSSGDIRVYRLNIDVTADWGALWACDSTHGALMAYDFRNEDLTIVSTDVQKGLAVHEFGHAFELGHVGIGDNLEWTPRRPSISADSNMSDSELESLKNIEIDDWGHLQKQVDVADGRTPLYLSGNGSFEKGDTKGFRMGSGASLTWHAAGGHGTGSAHGRIDGTSADPTIWHSTRLWRDSADGLPDIDAAAYVKHDEAPGVLGHDEVTMKLRARRVEITTCGEGGGNQPQIYQSPNANCPSTPNPYAIEDTVVVSVTNSWKLMFSIDWNVPNDWIGADLQVRIFNELTDQSDDVVPLWVDEVTIGKQ